MNRPVRPGKGRVKPNRCLKFIGTRYPVTNYKMCRATYFEIFQKGFSALQTYGKEVNDHSGLVSVSLCSLTYAV